MPKKLISLFLILSLLSLYLPDVLSSASDTTGFIEHPGSFGWNDPYALTFSIGDESIHKNANFVAVTVKKLSDGFSRGSLEVVSVNGQKPFDVNSIDEGISKYASSSNKYVTDDGNMLFYQYRTPYSGAKEIEILLQNTSWETDYIDYAIYIGFIEINEITQADYNLDSIGKISSSDGKYYEMIEHYVTGTSVQVSPVHLSYQLLSSFEGNDLTIGRDDDPYRDQFSLSSRSNYDNNSLPPLEAHLQGKYGHYSHEIDHYFSNEYRLKSDADKKGHLEMLSLMHTGLKHEDEAIKDILLDSNHPIINRFGGEKGYLTEVYISNESERTDEYFDASGKYTKVTHTVSYLQYHGALAIVMPNETVHVISFSRNIAFPKAHFTVEGELTIARSEFDQFLGTFALVPKNKGMTPQEYGDFIKGDNTFSIQLVSSNVTVPNTGIYDTGTADDSQFLPGIRINKPSDFSGTMILEGKIIGTDENPPIAFFEGKETFNVSQRTDSDFVSFNMVTRGVRGGKNNGLDFNPNQKVKFTLKDTEGNTLARPVILNVKLVDVSPKIILVEGPKTAAQSGAERSFTVRVEDADDDTLELTITSPFGQVRVSGTDFKKTMKVSQATYEDFQIGFLAPEIGNFNLNKELQNLSMVALQEGTFTTLAADLEGMALQSYTDKLKSGYDANSKVFRSQFDWNNYDQKLMAIDSIKQAGQNYEKWNKINTNYGHFGNSMNAINAAKNAQLGEDIAEAMNTDNKGIFEASVDVGIASINVLQTGVGLFTSALSYVPGGRAVAGKTVMIFNLSTNVWKANLQYLSKLEKIDRAEEVTELIPVIISTEDKSGFDVRFVILVPVIGMEV